VSGELEASDRRVVLVLSANLCRTGDDDCPDPERHSAVMTGQVRHDLDVVAGCLAAECDPQPCRLGRADVTADAIAYEDCHGVHVRDYAEGASPAARDFPGRVLPRIAGPYLAATTGDDEVTVSNWKDGEDEYSVDAPYGYDVQPDGKLAFGSIRWASPAEPYPHTVVNSLPPSELLIANDRIAARFDNPPADIFDRGYRGQLFDVLGLEQRPFPDDYAPRQLDRRALYGMDFDGIEVMWASMACRHAWRRTWDTLDLRIVGDLPERCPFPRIVAGSGRVDAERALSVRLRCAVPPGPACVGFVRRVGRRGKPLHAVPYSIAEGREKTVRLPRRGSLCRAGASRARAVIQFIQTGTPAKRKRTVSAGGPTAGLPGC
jgi:hypothetical protein